MIDSPEMSFRTLSAARKRATRSNRTAL